MKLILSKILSVSSPTFGLISSAYICIERLILCPNTFVKFLMARLLIYPKQQRYNVRYEKNWIFIEANQFFYYFYLSFHNQRGAPLRPAAAHVETENTGQADAEGSLTERNTENVKLLRGLRRTALLVLPAALPGMNL